MDPIELPIAAENIRKGIKEMIPETKSSLGQLPEIKAEIRDDGNKTYLGELAAGKALAEKISFLTKEMHLGDVCMSGILDWVIELTEY